MRHKIAALAATVLLAGGALANATSASATVDPPSGGWDHTWTTSDSNPGGTGLRRRVRRRHLGLRHGRRRSRPPRPGRRPVPERRVSHPLHPHRLGRRGRMRHGPCFAGGVYGLPGTRRWRHSLAGPGLRRHDHTLLPERPLAQSPGRNVPESSTAPLPAPSVEACDAEPGTGTENSRTKRAGGPVPPSLVVRSRGRSEAVTGIGRRACPGVRRVQRRTGPVTAEMDFSCHACMPTVAVPPSAKASTPVLEGSGKIWSVRVTCSPLAFWA